MAENEFIECKQGNGKYIKLDAVIALGRPILEAEKCASTIEKDLGTGFVNKVEKGYSERRKHPDRSSSSNTERRGRSHSRRHKSRHNSRHESQPRKFFETLRKSHECFRYGGNWPHKGACPAMGQVCKKCGKEDHFAKQCQDTKKQDKYVRRVEYNSDEEYYYVNSINGDKSPKITLKLNNKTTQLLLDTGASTNIIDEETFFKKSNYTKDT